VKKGNVIEPYVTHAEKFGTDGVMETARDAGLTLKELGELLVECDRIHASHLKRTRRFATPTKHRLTVEQRVKRLCGIAEEEE
jgi:hypothetical protein